MKKPYFFEKNSKWKFQCKDLIFFHTKKYQIKSKTPLSSTPEFPDSTVCNPSAKNGEEITQHGEEVIVKCRGVLGKQQHFAEVQRQHRCKTKTTPVKMRMQNSKFPSRQIQLWTRLSWRGKSKLLNEHWTTETSLRFQVWGWNPSPGNSMFPGLGFESQSRLFFRFFPFSQLSTTVNQWPWLGFEPQTWKRGIWCGTGRATIRCRGKEGKRPMMPIAWHSVPMGVH